MNEIRFSGWAGFGEPIWGKVNGCPEIKGLKHVLLPTGKDFPAIARGSRRKAPRLPLLFSLLPTSLDPLLPPKNHFLFVSFPENYKPRENDHKRRRPPTLFLLRYYGKISLALLRKIANGAERSNDRSQDIECANCTPLMILEKVGSEGITVYEVMQKEKLKEAYQNIWANVLHFQTLL